MQLTGHRSVGRAPQAKSRRSIAPQALLSGLTAALTGNSPAARESKKAEVGVCGVRVRRRSLARS